MVSTPFSSLQIFLLEEGSVSLKVSSAQIFKKFSGSQMKCSVDIKVVVHLINDVTYCKQLHYYK